MTSASPAIRTPRRFTLGPRTVDLDDKVVVSDGVTTHLSDAEVRLLEQLLLAGGRPVAPEHLLRHALGYRAGVDTRALPNAISRLRKKLELEPERPTHLLLQRGVGYRLQDALEVSAVSAQEGAPAVLVGRKAAWRVLEQLEHGLLTVVGPGGIGKTRLVADWARQRPRPLFVDLTSARDTPMALHAMASAMSLRTESMPQPEIVEHLAAVMCSEHSVAVLDNVEQLLPDFRPVLETLSGRGPVVVTSRHRVESAAEKVLVLDPLEPDEALALFLSRAGALGAAFSESEAHALGAALDGVPLNIELAAAMAPLLGAVGLAQQLTSGAALSSPEHGAHANRPRRQRSVEASLQWSWDLLAPCERESWLLLAQLPGGVDLEAAQAVFGADALKRLGALWSRSLLMRREQSGAPRWVLHPHMRAFALARLAADPAVAHELAARALQVALLDARKLRDEARARAPLSGPRFDNAEYALANAAVGTPAEDRLVLGLGLVPGWLRSGLHERARAVLAQFVADETTPLATRAVAALELAPLEQATKSLARAQANYELAATHAPTAEQRVRALVGLAEALRWQGANPQSREALARASCVLDAEPQLEWLRPLVMFEQVRDAAFRSRYAETIALAETLLRLLRNGDEPLGNDPVFVASVLFEQGAAALNSDNPALAERLLLEADAAFDHAHDPRLAGRITVHLLGLDQQRGETTRSIQRFHAVAPTLERAGLRSLLATAMTNCVIASLTARNYGDAEAWLARIAALLSGCELQQHAAYYCFRGVHALLTGRAPLALGALELAQERALKLERPHIVGLTTTWLALARHRNGAAVDTRPLHDLLGATPESLRAMIRLVLAEVEGWPASTRADARAHVEQAVAQGGVTASECRILLDVLATPCLRAPAGSETGA